MNKKGYILLETIIAISILGIVLVSVYFSFSNIIVSERQMNKYDNPEYLYKTNLIRKTLKNIEPEDKELFVVCSNYLNIDCNSLLDGDIYRNLGVEAIYIIKENYNIQNLDLEPTTLKYLARHKFNTNDIEKRILVMFRDENFYKYNKENLSDEKDMYEYANLKWE